MVPLPIFSEPFRRIAHCSTPPKRQAVYLGYMRLYIRFLEAVPMKSIDAVHIAEELLVLLFDI